MRFSNIIGFSVLMYILVVTGCASNRDQPTRIDPTGAVAGVAEKLNELADAVRHRDGSRMIGLYADRDTVVFSSHGVMISSRDMIAGVYKQWPEKTTSLDYFAWDARRYEVLSPDAVVAMGTFSWAMADTLGNMPDTLRATWTGVFKDQNGRWALVHEHESFQAK